MKKVGEWKMIARSKSFHFSVCLIKPFSEKKKTATGSRTYENASTLSVLNKSTDNTDNRSEDIKKVLMPQSEKASVILSSNTPCIIKGASITRRPSACAQVEDVESFDPIDDTGDSL